MSGRGELLLQGSDVDLSVLAPIRERLRIDEIVAEGLEPYLHAYKRVNPADVGACVPDRLVADAAIVGTPVACRSRLAAYVAAGVDHVIVDSPQPATELIAALRP
jgi:alkanesulfonate monooxygenase SsuD/methylene tetrahydromethanopterin reductase-like flavin-dependent oxidoreductase (luciferase family)